MFIHSVFVLSKFREELTFRAQMEEFIQLIGYLHVIILILVALALLSLNFYCIAFGVVKCIKFFSNKDLTNLRERREVIENNYQEAPIVRTEEEAVTVPSVPRKNSNFDLSMPLPNPPEIKITVDDSQVYERPIAAAESAHAIYRPSVVNLPRAPAPPEPIRHSKKKPEQTPEYLEFEGSEALYIELQKTTSYM